MIIIINILLLILYNRQKTEEKSGKLYMSLLYFIYIFVTLFMHIFVATLNEHLLLKIMIISFNAKKENIFFWFLVFFELTRIHGY